MTTVVVDQVTRWSAWDECDEDVLALRFRYADDVRLAVKSGLENARLRRGEFAGSWDNEARFWWCYAWAWPSVRAALERNAIDYDDSAVASAEGGQQQGPPPRLQPHEVLGVALTATEVEVREAYKRLIRQWHPDRIPLDVAEELRQIADDRAKLINAAYDAFKGRFARRTGDR